MNFLGSVLYAFLIGTFASFASALYFLPPNSFSNLANIFGLILAVMSYQYILFHIVNASRSSIRAHIIREIYLSGGITKNELLSHYNDKTIIRNRIKRLHEGGKIRMVNKNLVFSGRNFFFIARAFLIAKRLMFRR